MKSESHGGASDQTAIRRNPLRLGGMWWLCLMIGSRLLRLGAAAQLRTLEGFVQHAEPERLQRWRESVVQQSTGLAANFPDEVAAVLVRVYASELANVPPHARQAVERGWLLHSVPDKFDTTWDTLSRMSDPQMPEHGAELLIGSLHAGVQEIGRELLSSDFRRGVSRRLEQRLAHPVSADADGTVLEFFELVMLPDGGGHSPGYWQCILGDRARRHGDHDEAIARYRAAVQDHQDSARPRLAYLLALEGHQLLLQGEFSLALEHLRAAESLTADPEYRLLSAIGRLLSQPGATASTVSDLVRLRGELATPEVADLWIGVAQLESGDHVAAAATLRRSFGAEPGAADPTQRNPDDMGQLGTLLLHIAEGGAEGIVALARELLHRHGDRWAQRSPVLPDAVIADVADRDPVLLSGLVSILPNEKCLSRSTRVIAAHAMLNAAVQASDAGIALNRLEVAERLLQSG